MLWTEIVLTFRTIFVPNMFSPCSAKRRASDKDLPVPYVSIIALCQSGVWTKEKFKDSKTFVIKLVLFDCGQRDGAWYSGSFL